MSDEPPISLIPNVTVGTAVIAPSIPVVNSEAARFIQDLSTNETLVIQYNTELMNFNTDPDGVTQWIQSQGYNTTVEAALALANRDQVAEMVANEIAAANAQGEKNKEAEAKTPSSGGDIGKTAEKVAGGIGVGSFGDRIKGFLDKWEHHRSLPN